MWLSRVLFKKINKLEINIKTYHVIWNMSYDSNFEDYNTSRLQVEQSLKITILHKFIINAPGLTKVIIDIVIRYYSLPDSIDTNWELFFALKF